MKNVSNANETLSKRVRLVYTFEAIHETAILKSSVNARMASMYKIIVGFCLTSSTRLLLSEKQVKILMRSFLKGAAPLKWCGGLLYNNSILLS